MTGGWDPSVCYLSSSAGLALNGCITSDGRSGSFPSNVNHCPPDPLEVHVDTKLSRRMFNA